MRTRDPRAEPQTRDRWRRADGKIREIVVDGNTVSIYDGLVLTGRRTLAEFWELSQGWTLVPRDAS